MPRWLRLLPPPVRRLLLKARADRRQLRELTEQARLWAAYETSMARKVRPLVARHMRAGADGYEDRGAAGIEHALADAGPAWFRLLTPIYAGIGKAFGKRSQAALLGKAIGAPEEKLPRGASEYDAFEALLMSWIETEGLEQAKLLAAATRADLAAVIAAGESEGLSVAQIALNIRKSTPAMARQRARTIARTEVHNAAGFANHHAAVSAGMELEHKWLAHPGPRTRDTHLEAGVGPWIPLNEPFIVGGAQLRYPGDASMGAPAEEIINCRCGELQRVKRGAQADAIAA